MSLPLRAIIIDDEQRGINALKLVISEFIHDLKVVAECTEAGSAIELVENYRPEIVFLDIHMPGLNGFELLEKLRWQDFHLVFVTSHEEYALRALKKNAFDYLLKPVDHHELEETLARIRSRIGSRERQYIRHMAQLLNELNYSSTKNKILINLKSGIEPVDLNDIVYIESRSNYSQIHVTDLNAYLVPKTLRELEESLIEAHPFFMRVHHSYIINIHKIARYLKSEETIVMANGKKIPLAKSRRDIFYSWLNS